jgi:hypothetical protein
MMCTAFLLAARAQITAGTDHACALGIDYTARCWGRGNYGQVAVPIVVSSYEVNFTGTTWLVFIFVRYPAPPFSMYVLLYGGYFSATVVDTEKKSGKGKLVCNETCPTKVRYHQTNQQACDHGRSGSLNKLLLW